MLTKRQLEDAAKCPQNGLCTKCEMDCVRTLYNGYFDGCISEAAQTALAYRAMLERLHAKAESMFSYVEDSEAGFDPGTYDTNEMGEIEELLEENIENAKEGPNVLYNKA